MGISSGNGGNPDKKGAWAEQVEADQDERGIYMVAELIDHPFHLSSEGAPRLRFTFRHRDVSFVGRGVDGCRVFDAPGST